jgi:Zn-dependent peptidase ImmA (M78 family)
MASVEQINPRILTWARETAGFSLPEAADKLGFKDTTKATGAEKLNALEHGDGRIARTVLQNAAAVFRRPVVTFYLAEPPRRGERGQDFRVGAGSVSVRENAMLDALVRDVRARQQIVREVLIDEDEAALRPFVGSLTISVGFEAISAAIRETLSVSADAQRHAKDPAKLFALLKTAAERAGVYVLLLGDLGSYHSDIGEEVFRGFALADDVAPFVVINDNDAATARSFTLIHELAHIWLGASGVSGPVRGLSSNAIESICNDVASHLLLPPEALLNLSPDIQGADAPRAMSLSAEIAGAWNISQGVVIYRFVRNGWISEGVAGTLFGTFTERWRREKQRGKEERDPEAGSPTYYQLRRSGLGAPLLDLVRRGIQGETLTRTRAAKVLGVKPPAVDALLQQRSRAA